MSGLQWMGGFLAAVGLVGGCSSDGASEIRMTGEAVGTHESGVTASCSMDLVFIPETEVWSRTGNTYRGKFGGGIQRAVLDQEGAGEGFFMDVYGDMVVEWTFPDRFVVLMPESIESESRFWRELARLEGVDDDGAVTGTWTCAPLEIDRGEFEDFTVSVEGSWSMTSSF